MANAWTNVYKVDFRKGNQLLKCVTAKYTNLTAGHFNNSIMPEIVLKNYYYERNYLNLKKIEEDKKNS